MRAEDQVCIHSCVLLAFHTNDLTLVHKFLVSEYYLNLGTIQTKEHHPSIILNLCFNLRKESESQTSKHGSFTG